VPGRQNSPWWTDRRGAVWAQGGRTRVVFGFTITDGKIVAFDLLADAGAIEHLDLRVLEA
jgi:hypothetical protein